MYVNTSFATHFVGLNSESHLKSELVSTVSCILMSFSTVGSLYLVIITVFCDVARLVLVICEYFSICYSPDAVLVFCCKCTCYYGWLCAYFRSAIFQSTLAASHKFRTPELEVPCRSKAPWNHYLHKVLYCAVAALHYVSHNGVQHLQCIHIRGRWANVGDNVSPKQHCRRS